MGVLMVVWGIVPGPLPVGLLVACLCACWWPACVLAGGLPVGFWQYLFQILSKKRLAFLLNWSYPIGNKKE